VSTYSTITSSIQQNYCPPSTATSITPLHPAPTTDNHDEPGKLLGYQRVHKPLITPPHTSVN